MMLSFVGKAARLMWFLPGFLLWASFPPMAEMADCLFALAPLMWLSRNGDTKTVVWRWFLNGALFWTLTLSWMPAIVKNGGPWPLVLLGWGALAAYCAAYFALFGWLSSKVWRFAKEHGYACRLGAILVAEPILWAGLELVRSRLMGGFAWNQLGVVPANGGFGAPAALGGVYLLSMVVVLVNGTVASIAERMLAPLTRQRRVMALPGGTVEVDESASLPRAAASSAGDPPRWVRSVETFLPFVLIWCLYHFSNGLLRPERQCADEGPSPIAVSVAMVQRNFPCVFSGREEDPVAVYAKLLENVTPLRPDFVVLPESAFCEIGRFGTANAQRFATWICERTGAKAVLAGGTRSDGGREFNSAALYVMPRGDSQTDALEPQIYDKVHLVPFGEYIPGDKTFTALQKLAPVGSCTPGELRTLDLFGAKVGVAICFEDTDSAQIRRLAAMGARMLVFITNDSWFSRSDEALQHAWQSTARAVETGLPVVRVGNSGVTGTISLRGAATWLVDANGRPLQDRRGTMFDRVALPCVDAAGGGAAPLSPYVRIGDVPLAAAFAALLLFVFASSRRPSRAADFGRI